MRLLSILLSLAFLSGCIIPTTKKHQQRLDAQEATWMKVRDQVDYVKFEQDNVSDEVRMLENKLESSEEIMGLARRELREIQQKNGELLSRSLSGFESRLSKIEARSNSSVEDLRDLKTHANDVGTSLGQVKQRFNGLERSLDAQVETVRNLEGAVRALMALVESGKGTASSSLAAGASAGANVYRVSPGDTLEKIARRKGVTIRQLKNANNLSGDLIRVGQSLKIPE